MKANASSPAAAASDTGRPPGKPKEEVAYRELRWAILEGDLAPGTRINISETARTMAISEIPVRAALQRLAGEGMVRLTPNAGFYVTEHDRTTIAEAVLVMADLWTLTGKLAALRATEDDLAELQAIHDRSKLALDAGDVHGFLSIGRRFHNSLVAAAHSDYLYRLMDLVRTEAGRGVGRYNPATDRAQDAYQSHEQTLQALRARQPQRVAQLLRWHATDSLAVADLFPDGDPRSNKRHADAIEALFDLL